MVKMTVLQGMVVQMLFVREACGSTCFTKFSPRFVFVALKLFMLPCVIVAVHFINLNWILQITIDQPCRGIRKILWWIAFVLEKISWKC